MKFLALLLILISLQTTYVQSQSWSYGPYNGPEQWPNLFPGCAGNSQSPIDIRTGDTTPVTDSIQFSNYDVEIGPLTLDNNNGVSARVRLAELENPPTISNTLFGGNELQYVLEDFHFHWGRTSADGSEHHIDGNNYPLEMHLVHFNRETYENLESATGQPNGLAVIAVLFSISEDDNPNLSAIVDNLQAVTQVNSSTPIPNIIFNNLLPEDRSYYYYSGSLTTPLCFQPVHWAVLGSTNSISENQLTLFRNLLNRNGQPLVDNFRPTQDLNDRIVRHYTGS